MDLSVLSPEEIETLRTALDQYQNVSPSHPDIEQDKDFLEPVIQAIELLTNAMDCLNEKVEGLEKVVMDDIIGGVKGLYDDNMKSQSISGIKSKYGSMFDPLESAWKEDGDIYEKLYDVIEELKSKVDYSPEMEDGEIKGLAEMLQKKVDVNPSTSNDPVVEIEAKGSPDKLQEMLTRIKQQKEKSKGLSIF